MLFPVPFHWAKTSAIPTTCSVHFKSQDTLSIQKSEGPPVRSPTCHSSLQEDFPTPQRGLVKVYLPSKNRGWGVSLLPSSSGVLVPSLEAGNPAEPSRLEVGSQQSGPSISSFLSRSVMPGFQWAVGRHAHLLFQPALTFHRSWSWAGSLVSGSSSRLLAQVPQRVPNRQVTLPR